MENLILLCIIVCAFLISFLSVLISEKLRNKSSSKNKIHYTKKFNEVFSVTNTSETIDQTIAKFEEKNIRIFYDFNSK